MAWSEDQINDVLAELGLRTPGKPMPDEPERIVVEALLDARARVKELVAEVLEANTRYERENARIEGLQAVASERDALKLQVDECQTQSDKALILMHNAVQERDAAFTMVRELEIRVREMQSQIDSVTSIVPRLAGLPNSDVFWLFERVKAELQKRGVKTP